MRYSLLKVITISAAMGCLNGCGGSSSEGGQNTSPSAQSNSVTLEWSPPTTNSDGTTLTNLAGYRIYFSNRDGYFDHAIELSNPGLSRFVVDNLPSGTYYFTATSYNTFGIESEYSPVVTITVQ